MSPLIVIPAIMPVNFCIGAYSTSTEYSIRDSREIRLVHWYHDSAKGKKVSEAQKTAGPTYFNFGLPCGRVVISRPSFLVAVVAHVSSPNGEPRLTLRRMAASSASE